MSAGYVYASQLPHFYSSTTVENPKEKQKHDGPLKWKNDNVIEVEIPPAAPRSL